MNISWPPPYILRISHRAKNLRLEITQRKGLELIVPKNVSEKVALKFLEKNRAWIEKNKAYLKENVESDESFSIPDKIHLPAIEKSWEVTHDSFSKKRISMKIFDKKIFLTGKQIAERTFRKLMLGFLKKVADKHLREKLHFLSEEYDLMFNRVGFRLQKSRWGSCSEDKNISLNLLLLFMPRLMAEYIMIHELCHLEYHDHSKAFWQRVASIMPDYKMHKRMLNHYEMYLPVWLKNI